MPTLDRHPTMTSGHGFSLVIPFYNEADNVRFVIEEARQQLPQAEILAIDDASDDGTWTELCRLPGIRPFRLSQHAGQSAAIYHGLRACTGPVCGLMDGDGQNDPANFHLLLAELARGQADVVCGYRRRRNDRWNRRVASRIANRIRQSILHDGIRDTGCSQKVFPRSAVELLIPFRGLHRYLPAFFRSAGLRIVEIPVEHRPRRAGISKYNNWNRAIVGIHDLVGVRWLLRRRLPPAQLQSPP